LDLIAEIVEHIVSEPHHYDLEPWPPGVSPSGWIFRKADAIFRGFSDRAQLVRLMYAVSDEMREVRLLLVYTHAQFSTRPGDESLLTALKGLFDWP